MVCVRFRSLEVPEVTILWTMGQIRLPFGRLSYCPSLSSVTRKGLVRQTAVAPLTWYEHRLPCLHLANRAYRARNVLSRQRPPWHSASCSPITWASESKQHHNTFSSTVRPYGSKKWKVVNTSSMLQCASDALETMSQWPMMAKGKPAILYINSQAVNQTKFDSRHSPLPARF